MPPSENGTTPKCNSCCCVGKFTLCDPKNKTHSDTFARKEKKESREKQPAKYNFN